MGRKNHLMLPLVLEADAFVPQRPMGELTRVFGEVDRIAKATGHQLVITFYLIKCSSVTSIRAT